MNEATRSTRYHRAGVASVPLSWAGRSGSWDSASDRDRILADERSRRAETASGSTDATEPYAAIRAGNALTSTGSFSTSAGTPTGRSSRTGPGQPELARPKATGPAPALAGNSV